MAQSMTDYKVEHRSCFELKQSIPYLLVPANHRVSIMSISEKTDSVMGPQNI